MKHSRMYPLLVSVLMTLTGCLDIIATQGDESDETKATASATTGSSTSDGSGGDGATTSVGAGGDMTGASSSVASSTSATTGGSTTVSASSSVASSSSVSTGSGGEGGMGGAGGAGSTSSASSSVASSSSATSSSSTVASSSASSSSSSTASSSSASSSSSSAATTSSSSTGGGPVMGVLTVVVFHPNQSASHGYTYYDWIDPSFTQNSNGFAVDIDLEEGIDYVFNGTTDGNQWWCSGANTFNVLVGAWWNDDPIMVEPKWNGGSGCNFKVHTASIACPANDQDCDGYDPNNPNQSLKDCNDSIGMIRPNQLETWGDAVDTDCDLHVDPPSWKYAVSSLAQGANIVQVVDISSWSNQQNDFTVMYPMTWNGIAVAYETSVGNWLAPHEYVTRWKMNANDPWTWGSYKQNNQCVALATHQVTETHYNTVVNFAMDPAKMCHFVKP